MAKEKTLEELQSEIATLQSDLKAKDEENTSLKAEIEAAIAENSKLQAQLEKAEIATEGDNTVEVNGETYRILHGGMGLADFGAFTPKDIQSNEELAEKLVEIGFGGLELISND